MNLIISSFL